MCEIKQIVIEPGVTDLSTIPTSDLEGMVQAAGQTINEMTEEVIETIKEIEEVKEIQKVLIAERNRMKEELNNRKAAIRKAKKIQAIEEAIENMMHLVPNPVPQGVPHKVEAFEAENGKLYVRIPLPVADTDWTFRAWNWAKTFCRNYREFYPNHEAWQEPKFVYLEYGVPQNRW